jgi:hypothetical protein
VSPPIGRERRDLREIEKVCDVADEEFSKRCRDQVACRTVRQVEAYRHAADIGPSIMLLEAAHPVVPVEVALEAVSLLIDLPPLLTRIEADQAVRQIDARLSDLASGRRAGVDHVDLALLLGHRDLPFLRPAAVIHSQADVPLHRPGRSRAARLHAVVLEDLRDPVNVEALHVEADVVDCR